MIPTVQPLSQRLTAFPVETLRGGAILVVVFYHVIGSAATGGLRLTDGSGWRELADLLNEIHMPVFALLAGLVYAMKPVAGRTGGTGAVLASFARDKLRRLAVPGLLAMLVFAAAMGMVPTRQDPAPPLWLLPVRPFLHFWFLQAIFVVLLAIAATDRLTGSAGLAWGLAAGVVLLLSPWRVPTSIMSLNGAMWLWPYAVAGVLIWRGRDRLAPWRGVPGLAALTLALLGLAGWMAVPEGADLLSTGHGAPWQLALAFGVTLAALALVPDMPALAWLGPPSFAIYLYHPLFTSGARRLLEGLGVEIAPQTLPLHIAAGVTLGVLGPLAIYGLAMRGVIGRRLVLGLRR